ncbi:MAG: hypothetical protein ACTH8P_15700 [Ewingella sp.]|uniref:hypothetical protein n=1 Tax=Ewingella TaxID=41201 RepID=UPI00336530ED
MFNSLEKQTLKVIQDLAPLLKDLSSKYQIGEIKLSITGSVFSFGKPAGVSIRVIEKNADNYEAHWDSLIFSILGADAKADIIDSVDIERTTNNAMKYIKNMAFDLYQQRLMAKSFQRASRDHYRKMMESEISDFFASLYQPGSPDVQNGGLLQAELMKRVSVVFADTKAAE